MQHRIAWNETQAAPVGKDGARQVAGEKIGVAFVAEQGPVVNSSCVQSLEFLGRLLETWRVSQAGERRLLHVHDASLS